MLVQSGLEAARSKILPSSFAGMGAKFEPSHWPSAAPCSIPQNPGKTTGLAFLGGPEMHEV